MEIYSFYVKCKINCLTTASLTDNGLIVKENLCEFKKYKVLFDYGKRMIQSLINWVIPIIKPSIGGLCLSDGRRIRTFDRLLRRQVLYPAELCHHFPKEKVLRFWEYLCLLMSGWQDSNLRPPRPKRGAITGLRYTPRPCNKVSIFQ